MLALAAVVLPASADFSSCIQGLAERARSEGIDATLVARVLNDIEPAEGVISSDAAQPEFTRTFIGYYPARVTDRRVSEGRRLLRQHEQLLIRIQRETGVPPQYLLAFWGLETNYGSFLGNHSVPAALATLACDGRRANYFGGELMNALRIIERGDVDAAAMRGSWAGAMGNMQFMPSTFIEHAVDADGDGRRDLWGSVEDALTSAGHFLAALGWQPGLRWGREVLLPDDFDYTQLDTEQPLSYWSARGVRNTAGSVVPPLDEPARILLPSGHTGPAFITYRNFSVIMQWNRSESYAVTVGRLADRIAGSGRLARPLPAGPTRWSIEAMAQVQRQLITAGFDPGEPDGLFGPATRAALRNFQADRGLRPDGFPDARTRRALEKISPG